MPLWTQEEVDQLKAHPHLSHKEVAALIGRSPESVKTKRYNMRRGRQEVFQPLKNFKGVRTGALPGSLHHNAKVTEDIVIQMREMYATGNYSWFKIWEHFYPTTGIESMSTIGCILTRKTWKHV